MKKLLSVILCVGILASSASVMAEKKVSDWAKENVAFTEKSGIVPKSVYDSDYTVKITRKEFAETIYNLFKFTGKVSVADSATPFTDVNETYITALNKDGIINGVGEGKFDPDANLTRQEASTIFGRAVKQYCGAELTKGDSENFKDDSSIAHWAYEFVYAMKTAGILQGYDDGEFKPLNNMSREEAMTIVVRTAEIMKIDVKVVSTTTPVVSGTSSSSNKGSSSSNKGSSSSNKGSSSSNKGNSSSGSNSGGSSSTTEDDDVIVGEDANGSSSGNTDNTNKEETTPSGGESSGSSSNSGSLSNGNTIINGDDGGPTSPDELEDPYEGVPDLDDALAEQDPEDGPTDEEIEETQKDDSPEFLPDGTEE